MGIWTRRRADRDVVGLIHHSDKGVQHVAVRYTQRLAEAGAVARSAAPATPTTTPSPRPSTPLSKAEPVRNKGRGRASTTSGIAVAEYIDWFNHRRLHGEIGLIPPAEQGDNSYRHW
jgi:putative transposase